MRSTLLRIRARGRLTVGSGVEIGRRARVRVSPRARVTIAEGTRIGERLTIEAVAGHVRIGPYAWLGDGVRVLARADVTIAERCVLHDGATLLTSLPAHADPDAPAARRAPYTAAVTLEAGARLRERAAVEPGVTVAAGAEVGAREVAGSAPRPGPQTAAPSRSA